MFQLAISSVQHKEVIHRLFRVWLSTIQSVGFALKLAISLGAAGLITSVTKSNAFSWQLSFHFLYMQTVQYMRGFYGHSKSRSVSPVHPAYVSICVKWKGNWYRVYLTILKICTDTESCSQNFSKDLAFCFTPIVDSLKRV